MTLFYDWTIWANLLSTNSNSTVLIKMHLINYLGYHLDSPFHRKMSWNSHNVLFLVGPIMMKFCLLLGIASWPRKSPLYKVIMSNRKYRPHIDHHCGRQGNRSWFHSRYEMRRLKTNMYISNYYRYWWIYLRWINL